LAFDNTDGFGYYLSGAGGNNRVDNSTSIGNWSYAGVYGFLSSWMYD